ncbi:MAG: hypothetical protein F6K35_32080, partial [Okeania sp. SIO2H7]|nr:hypothetical protein [Okeania sp. SIO2H7]
EAAEERAAATRERQETLRVIAEQESFIRGLQTENKRMWEYLTGRQNQDDNPDT